NKPFSPVRFPAPAESVAEKPKLATVPVPAAGDSVAESAATQLPQSPGQLAQVSVALHRPSPHRAPERREFVPTPSPEILPSQPTTANHKPSTARHPRASVRIRPPSAARQGASCIPRRAAQIQRFSGSALGSSPPVTAAPAHEPAHARLRVELGITAKDAVL